MLFACRCLFYPLSSTKTSFFRSSPLSSDSGSGKKHLSIAIRLIVATGVLCLVFWNLDWGKLRDTFLAMRAWVFLFSVFLFVVCQFMVSFRWWMMLRTQSIHIGIWPAVRLNFLGLFYNNFLPGAVGGDLVRGWYVTKYTHRRFEAALSVLVDRIIGLISIAVLAFFAWWVFFDFKALDLGQSSAGRLLRVFEGHTREILIGVIAAAVVAMLLMLIPAVRRRLAGVWEKVKHYGEKIYHRGYDAAKLYLKSPWTLLATILLTFVSQSIVVVGFWLIGQDMGIVAPFRYYMVFFPLSWVLGALPISVAGAGVVEGWLAVLFTHNLAGVSWEAATALALCQRAVWMIVSLPGLGIYLTGGHLPKDFSVDYESSVN